MSLNRKKAFLHNSYKLQSHYLLIYCKHLTFQIDGPLINNMKAGHIVLPRKNRGILLLGSLGRVAINNPTVSFTASITLWIQLLAGKLFRTCNCFRKIFLRILTPLYQGFSTLAHLICLMWRCLAASHQTVAHKPSPLYQ